MDDVRLAGDGSRNRSRVGDIALENPDAAPRPRGRDPVTWENVSRNGRRAVSLDQAGHQDRPDKSRGSGDEDVHRPARSFEAIRKRWVSVMIPKAA